MVEKIKNDSEKIKSNEKLDLKNDPEYKLLYKNFWKVKILDKNNNPVSKDNLPDFYKKIKEESFKQIDKVLQNSKSNVVELFWSKEKFEEAVFKEALDFSIGYWIIRKDLLSLKDHVSGLLEFNYKSKDDFKNAFRNFYIWKEDADFIKKTYGTEKITWQQSKKLGNILSCFGIGGNYSNLISWKLNKENITLLSQLSGNFWDLPNFSGKKYFWYLKNLWLIQNWKIGINTAIDIIWLLQWKVDFIQNINWEKIDNNKIFIYDLASYSIFEQSILDKINDKNFWDEVSFLIKNIWLSNTSDLFDIYFKNLSTKNEILHKTAWWLWPNKSELINNLSIKIWEKNKDKFINIIHNLFPEYSYNKKNFETSKFQHIDKFILLFTNTDFNNKKFEENLAQDINNEFSQKTNKPFKYNQIESYKPKIITFLWNFFKKDGWIDNLKKQLSKWNIKDPINYMVQDFLNKETDWKDLKDSASRKLLNKLFYSIFSKYAEKIAKYWETKDILSSSTFQKLEKTIELKSKDINPYQASITSYYLCEYAIKNNNWKIDNKLLNSPWFKEFLEKNIWINIQNIKHKTTIVNGKKVKVMNTNDFDNNLFNNLNLWDETFTINEKTIEDFKQNNKLEEIAEKYKQMWYEWYIHYEEQVENEKKLLKETGSISKTIPINKSELFKNSQNLQKIDIKSKEKDGIYTIEAMIPGEKNIIQIKSLSIKDANSSLIKEITWKQFWINISFDNWSADDFSKIINTDITKWSLNWQDIENIKKFYQTYAVELVENGDLPKKFLRENNLKISDIYNNFDNFSKAFSSWMKSHLSLWGIKPLWNEFYIDKFNPTVKQVIEHKYEWNKIKENTLDKQNIWIFWKIKNFFWKIKI